MRATANRAISLGIMGAVLLLVSAVLPAQLPEPAFHGRIRHQLGVTIGDLEIVRNAVTAELEITVRGSSVGVFVNPYLETEPGSLTTVGLREAYLDAYSRHVDVRLGRQIVIWGKSDGLAITDIVSPRDLSSFLIPEFRELRLPVTAAKANAYLGPAELELIYIPVFTPSILPSPDSIWFAAFDAPVEPTLNPAPDVGSGVEDGEYYARLRLMGGRGDLDLAGGYFWTNEPAPTIEREFSAPGVPSGITVTPEHYRQTMAGGAFSSALGPIIVRGESAWFTPVRVRTSDPADAHGYAVTDRISSLVGIDTVVAGLDLSAQLMHEYLVGHSETMEQDEHSYTATLRVRRSFFREQLVMDAFGYAGINEPDALVKVGTTWTPADALSFRIETNLLFGESGRFGDLSTNDLIVVTAQYRF